MRKKKEGMELAHGAFIPSTLLLIYSSTVLKQRTFLMLFTLTVLFKLEQTWNVRDFSCLTGKDYPFSKIGAFEAPGLNF